MYKPCPKLLQPDNTKYRVLQPDLSNWEQLHPDDNDPHFLSSFTPAAEFMDTILLQNKAIIPSPKWQQARHLKSLELFHQQYYTQYLKEDLLRSSAISQQSPWGVGMEGRAARDFVFVCSTFKIRYRGLSWWHEILHTGKLQANGPVTTTTAATGWHDLQSLTSKRDNIYSRVWTMKVKKGTYSLFSFPITNNSPETFLVNTTLTKQLQ